MYLNIICISFENFQVILQSMMQITVQMKVWSWDLAMAKLSTM